MRAEADDLKHAADGAAVNEIAGVHGGFDVEPLAEINHVFAPCGGSDAAGFLELFEGGEGRFVGEVVLAGGHDAAADGAALVGDGGGGDEADVGIVEDFVERAGDAGLRKFLQEDVAFNGIGFEDPAEFGAGFEEAVALAVDVAVVEVRGGENEFARFHHGARLALRGVGHAVGFLGHGGANMGGR